MFGMVTKQHGSLDRWAEFLTPLGLSVPLLVSHHCLRRLPIAKLKGDRRPVDQFVSDCPTFIAF